MSLHDDLLGQSDRFANLDPRRPKQVHLRRAVSSTYYALFHLLTLEASALNASAPEMAVRIGRTINHGEMRKASEMIVGSKLPRALQRPGERYSPPAPLVAVAKAFVLLQDARHAADYDISLAFHRSEVVRFVQMAEEAFESWRTVRKNDDARLYLACFLLGERWEKAPR